MLKVGRLLNIISQSLQMALFTLITLVLFGCGPQSKKPVPSPVKIQENHTYEELEAMPTVIIPSSDATNPQNYQKPQGKIINYYDTEIILGSVELKNTNISYNSADQKMRITGHATLLDISKNNKNTILAEKDFVLLGTHLQNEFSFILADEIKPDAVNKLLIKAEARCLDKIKPGDLNCNHVMVDIYFFHNKKYYTEQIEVFRKPPPAEEPEPELTPAPVPTPTPVPAPAPPTENPTAPTAAPVVPNTQEPIIQKETEDQIQAQQMEGSDDSISGRYQGGAEVIDLAALFEEQAIELPQEHTPITPAPIIPAPKTEPVPTPIPPKKVKDTILSPQLVQTKKGEVRPINQATGFPDNGSLKNATSLLTRQKSLNQKANFEIVLPDRKRHFGTYELAELITQLSHDIQIQYSKKIYVSNLSAANGGKIAPHASHQNGLDADIAYPSELKNIKFPLVVKMKTKDFYPQNYSTEKTYNLFKYLFSQKTIGIDRIFVDQKIKDDLCNYAIKKNEFRSEEKQLVEQMFSNLQHVEGHGDHFHVRIKCSKYDPACRGRLYKKIDACKL